MAKRIITANYINHIRLKNEGRETYANIEDALQDFASRTGLNEMQKRALRRQVFVKLATHLPQMNFEDDKMLFENGNAPAAILPGIKPGSEKAKLLEKTRKKPFHKLTDLGPESQQNRDVEDNAQQKSPGSSDADSLIDAPSQTSAGYRAGIVIEASEELESDEDIARKKGPTFKFPTKPQGKRGPAQQEKSRERKILEEISELQKHYIHMFLKPGTTYSKPILRDDLTIAERKARNGMKSQIEALSNEYRGLVEKRKQKSEQESVKHKVEENNIKFNSVIKKLLGVKTKEEQKLKLKHLSPEGLQDLYNKAVDEFGSGVYHRPSQGTDPEHGDYVKCMVCDSHDKLWINNDNPGVIPFEHLETHADELLGRVERSPEGVIEYQSTEAGKYRENLINAYHRKFPGASLQSREQELAAELGREALRASPGIHPPHVATKTETKLNYTDRVLTDMVLHQFRRFGVDPDDKTLDELAKEVIEEIKMRLDDEFPNTLLAQDAEGKPQLREINYLESKNVPFEALHRAFREEVGRATEEYRGTFSDFKPLTKRHKRRWTSTERRTVQKERLEELRVKDVEQELATELGHWPTPAELAKKLRDLDKIQVGISITGGRGCWNCGNDELILVDNKRIEINSATCPKCGVYREVLVKVMEFEWEQKYVIRDVNENDPGGSKPYIIYEDSDYIGNGPKAIGNSRFVHILGREEQEIRTRLDEDKPTEPGKQAAPIKLEVGTAVYSQQFKHGRVVYIQDGTTWVAWESSQYERKVKLKDLKGEVISLQSSKARTSGFYIVDNIEINNEDETVTVHLKSPAGLPVVREWNSLEVLENEVPVASVVDPKELEKVEYASRRRIRERVLLKMSQEKQNRHVTHSVDRLVKAQKEVKQMPLVSRVNILKRKIKRSKLTKRLLGE